MNTNDFINDFMTKLDNGELKKEIINDENKPLTPESVDQKLKDFQKILDSDIIKEITEN